MYRVHVATLLSLFALACTNPDDDDKLSTSTTLGAEGGPDSSTSGGGDDDGPNTTAATSNGAEDPGDTDTSETGADTSETGTDTSETGADTSETGTDTDEPNEGCSDGDSGNAPFDDAVYDNNLDDEASPYGGGAFISDDEDFGNASSCDIFLQDCPSGEKCVPYASNFDSWDANKCVPVLGTGEVGDACVYGGLDEATDDCDANSACWDGICTAFCEGTAEAPICPVGTTCLQHHQGALAFCVAGCNPITQDCPEGDACFWSGDSFACVFTTLDHPLGEPCGFINDCAKGLACVAGNLLPSCNGTHCCAAFCDLDCGAGSCAQWGTSCVPFFEGQAPPGGADIGLCLAP